MEKIKAVFGCFFKNRVTTSFIFGILVSTIPLLIAYEYSSKVEENKSRSQPSVQLLDIGLSFEINDRVTYNSEDFKIPDFLFEEVTGNPHIYPLPRLSQRIPYKELRNYFISSHKFNKERPNDIETMMTKFKNIDFCLNSDREVDQSEADTFFLYHSAYGKSIMNKFNEFINYSPKTEIEEYFNKSQLFKLFNNDEINGENPQRISRDLQNKLSKRKKYFKYHDFITDEQIGWKISSDSLARIWTMTYGNHKLEPFRINYYKFYYYSMILHDRESLKLILNLLYTEYSDVESIRKRIVRSQSVNNETMKYFSRFKVSALFYNRGEKPITFMPVSALLIKNDEIFEYEYYDGSSYVRKALPEEIKIELSYYESFKTKVPFQLKENEGKIITLISDKQIKEIIDYQGILKAFDTGTLKCGLQGVLADTESKILSNQLQFKQNHDNSFNSSDSFYENLIN